MASNHHKGEAWHCQFVYHGKRHTFSLGKVPQEETEIKANQVDYLLMRLKQRLLHIPPGTDIVTYVQFDGKIPEDEPADGGGLTLAQLRDKCLATHRNGSLEQSTLDGIELHFEHLAGTLGDRFRLQQLSLSDLQGHVDRRARMKGLKGQTVLIHEKKRVKGKTTTRRVPLTPFLARVLKEWLQKRPGGPYLFRQCAAVVRSKTKRSMPLPITHDEAHDHFKRTLAKTKWKVIRGYHIFRHSFISLCASKRVDQRLIDEWTGHCTEELRRRYRHLFPTTQQQAMLSVFGK
jgi:hypothetical protein